MRQIMPHRNNIELRRTKSKRYFSIRWKNQFSAMGMSRRSRRAPAAACHETPARTGFYMIFPDSEINRASPEEYTRYADFAGARA